MLYRYGNVHFQEEIFYCPGMSSTHNYQSVVIKGRGRGRGACCKWWS
jgi:hypothetical protein